MGALWAISRGISLYAVVLAAVLGMLLAKGNVGVGVAILGVAMLPFLLPALRMFSSEAVLLSIVGLFLTLDVPAARPFYEYDPLTEKLGRLLFDHFGGISLFEVIAVCFSGWLLWDRHFCATVSEKSGSRWQRRFGLMACVGAPLGAVFIGNAFTGLFQGGEVPLAVLQIRPVLFVPFWMLIGFEVVSTPEVMTKVFWAITAATLFKAAQAYFVFLIPFAASMKHIVEGRVIEREYLIDHMTSDFFATAMIFLVFRNVVGEFSLKRIVWSFFGVSFLTLPYLLNDRRSSLLGVVISVALIPLVMPWRVFRRYLKPLGILFAVAVIWTAATWNMSGPLGYISHTVQSLVSEEGGTGMPSYRDIENFNLLSAVADNPLLGLGFGRRFPVLVQLPDISFVYDLFDAIPHNTFLYVWAFAGAAGMAALGCLVAVALWLLVRIGRESRDTERLLMGIVGFTMVIRWLIYAFADMGLIESRSLALIGILVGAAIRIDHELERLGKRV